MTQALYAHMNNKTIKKRKEGHVAKRAGCPDLWRKGVGLFPVWHALPESGGGALPHMNCK
jgi:hypothetical protein